LLTKLKYLVVLLLATSPAWATFTLVQHVNNRACAGSGSITTCNLTVTSTGSGHVIVIAVGLGGASKSITSVSGAGTYTHCTTCTATDSNGESSDMSYTLNSSSGVTTITVNFSSTAQNSAAVEMWELSFTGSSVQFDVGNNIDNSTNTNRGGASLTALTGTNDALFQCIFAGSTVVTVTAINGAYTTGDFGTVAAGNGTGFAVAINSATGTAPTWTFSGNARSAGSGLAISETSSGATVCKSCDLSQLVVPKLP